LRLESLQNHPPLVVAVAMMILFPLHVVPLQKHYLKRPQIDTLDYQWILLAILILLLSKVLLAIVVTTPGSVVVCRCCGLRLSDIVNRVFQPDL
jgi:hypothetical protein